LNRTDVGAVVRRIGTEGAGNFIFILFLQNLGFKLFYS